MSLINDISFAPRLGPFLKMFKHTGGYTWTFRCPYCKDSKKNKTKRRAGFFRGKDETSDMLLMSCFNCGVSTTLGKVVEYVSPELYDEYRFACYRENMPDDECDDKSDDIDLDFFRTASKQIEIDYDSSLDSIFRLDHLSPNHPAMQYLVSRKIPQSVWHLFYYAPKFMTWTNTLVQKFEMRDKDYPRLIIPFFNEHGRMFAFAARAFGDETPKYYTIKLDDREEKIYGRERLVYSKHIYVVEGQIDSMLLPNCIGVSGSSFDTPYVQGIKTNCTLVPDNEPRNSQIVAQYLKYIKAGYRVCMLPESFEFKDINEAIQGGMTPEEIVAVIDANTYQGLSAELRFASWQKCNTQTKKKPYKQKEFDVDTTGLRNQVDADCLAILRNK